MVELTRRWFVFGSAAAVAAAKLPLIHAAEAPSIQPFTPVVAPHAFKHRGIYELAIGFEDPGMGEFGEFTMYRGGGNPIMQIGINTRASYRWVAAPRHDIVLMPNDTFEIALKSPRGIGRVGMMVRDKIDEGPPIDYFEEHTFPSRGPALIVPLHPDNSLKARLDREADRN